MEAVREAVMREEREVRVEDLDDATVMRFLRARDMDVGKASAMMVKWWRWRRDFGLVREEEIGGDLAHNKMFMQGVDKSGRPIVVVMGGRHKQGNLQDFKRFVVYCLDKICSRMPSGHDKFISIADVEGWGYTNSDIRGYLGALSILQDFYPERLHKLFMLNVPPIFMAAWKMVYPFVDANTRNKIIFVHNSKLTSTLLQHIHPSHLPDIYGGQLSLVPIQNS